MKNYNIIIGADLVPVKSNYDLFSSGLKSKLMDNELEKILDNSNGRVFNLECVISDTGKKIDKCGPHLSAPTSVMPGIKALNPSLLTLANNHILDLGKEGLESTINQLDKYDINHIGAGKNLHEARKPYYIKYDDFIIGFYAVAENEFSSASPNKYGCNCIDLLEISDEIRNTKKNCDYLVILYHGGNERYRYPAPYLQKICRKLVNCGANLIICQHSHCVGCKEEFNGATIIYGQGNFHFYRENDIFFKSSILVNLIISKSKNQLKYDIDYIPIVLKEKMISLANEEEYNIILKEFYKRSDLIMNQQFIKNEYDCFSKRVSNDLYYFRALGRISDNILFKFLNKIFKKNLSKVFFSKKQKLAILNILKCEAHRETFINELEKYK